MLTLVNSIWQHLVTLTQTEKITVIITTHYIEEARQANVVGLMRAGRLLAENSPEELMAQYNLETLEEVFLKLCMTDSSIKAASMATTTGLTPEQLTHSNDSHSTPTLYHQMATNGDLKNGLKVRVKTNKSELAPLTSFHLSISVSFSFLSLQWKQGDKLYITFDPNPSQSEQHVYHPFGQL